MRPSLTSKLSALRPLLIKILDMHRNNNMTQSAIAEQLNQNLRQGERRYYQVKVGRLLNEAEALDADGLLHPHTVGATMAANAHRNVSLPVPLDEESRRAAIEGLQCYREQA